MISNVALMLLNSTTPLPCSKASLYIFLSRINVFDKLKYSVKSDKRFLASSTSLIRGFVGAHEIIALDIKCSLKSFAASIILQI